MFPMQDFIGGDGVVSIFLKSGRMISLPKSITSRLSDDDKITSQNITLRVRNGEFTQSFRPVAYNDGFPVWNQELHIPVHISSQKTNPSNALIMTLEIFDIYPTEKDTSSFVGGVVLHLFDIIPLESYLSSFQFFNNDQIPRVVGTAKMKLHFMYGIYGYGYSMQIDNMFVQGKSENKRTLYPKAEQKNFGKDLEPSAEEKIVEELDKIFQFKKLYDNKSKIMNRKDKLQSLRDFVLKEDHNISIDLDDSFDIIREQSIKLRSCLVPARFLKKTNDIVIVDRGNEAFPPSSNPTVMSQMNRDRQNNISTENQYNNNNENEIKKDLISSSSNSHLLPQSNTKNVKKTKKKKDEESSNSLSSFSSKETQSNQSHLTQSNSNQNNLNQNDSSHDDYSHDDSSHDDSNHADSNQTKNKKVKKLRKKYKKRRDSDEESVSSLDSITSESETSSKASFSQSSSVRNKRKKAEKKKFNRSESES